MTLNGKWILYIPNSAALEAHYVKVMVEDSPIQSATRL